MVVCQPGVLAHCQKPNPASRAVNPVLAITSQLILPRSLATFSPKGLSGPPGAGPHAWWCERRAANPHSYSIFPGLGRNHSWSEQFSSLFLPQQVRYSVLHFFFECRRQSVGKHARKVVVVVGDNDVSDDRVTAAGIWVIELWAHVSRNINVLDVRR